MRGKHLHDDVRALCPVCPLDEQLVVLGDLRRDFPEGFQGMRSPPGDVGQRVASCGLVIGSRSVVDFEVKRSSPHHREGPIQAMQGDRPEHGAQVDRGPFRKLMGIVLGHAARLDSQFAHDVVFALSRAIKELEEELGVVLFARATRSIRLTRAGKLLLNHAPCVFTALRRHATA